MTDSITVLRCEANGMITDLLLEGANLQGLVRPGHPLTALVCHDDFAKALDFMAAVRHHGSACDWEMAVATVAGDAVHRVSASKDAGGITVALAPADCPPEMLLAALAGLDHAPVTGLRQALRESTAGETGLRPYESMALINNDLITVQRELAKTNAKLKAANEMKNRVIGILAHDLRNPLNAIIGFTGLLEQILAGRTSDKEMSFLTAIHDAGRDMLTLVEDTLSMSALESGQMVLSCKPFDFADLAARTVRMLTVMAERKGVSLVFERPPTAVPIRADPTKISQVLNNLIINAIKFSHVGGEVRVTVSGETGEAACLTVTDHGTGIPAEMQARLYEPFVEGHRRGTAGESTTGLGLFICKSIVVAHGGTIAVTSQADWGSSFVVTLPAEC